VVPVNEKKRCEGAKVTNKKQEEQKTGEWPPGAPRRIPEKKKKTEKNKEAVFKGKEKVRRVAGANSSENSAC
jgi:hypothetical protein